MKTRRLQSVWLLLLFVFFMPCIAMSSSLVGLDTAGLSNYVYSDLWTNRTDTGLLLGFVPDKQVPPESEYQTNFVFQTRIAVFQKNGLPVIIPDIALSNAELTLVAKFPLVVDAQKRSTDVLNVNHELVSFVSGENVDGKLYIYLDKLSDGSQADPNVVAGYGDDDNIGPILTGHVLKVTASFDKTLTGKNAGLGTGSYDFQFVIDSVNSNYVDIETGSVLGIQATGTLNTPPFFSPSKMWDGTSTALPNIMLKVDGSQIYFPGNTCIDIVKEVSVNGGVSWFDANTLESAPGTNRGAQYRFTVTNCGSADLNNVAVTDPYLGIVDETAIFLGTLAAGAELVLTAANYPLLNLPNRCADVPPPGDGEPNKFNKATVVGEAGLPSPSNTVTAADPAWVKCVCVDIEKLVSVDGGQTFGDADSCDNSVLAQGAVEYQLVVTNCGSVALEDVVVNDPMLFGAPGYSLSGDLLPGVDNQVIITKNDDAGLVVDGFCDVFGNQLDLENKLRNTTVVEGVASLVNADVVVTDADSACVECSSCAGSIGDFVWDDVNRNGIQDGGESGIPNQEVTFTGTNIYNMPVSMTDTTDGNGMYLFEGLCAGTYTVSVATPSGYTPTMSNAPDSTPANDSNDSPANVTLTNDNSSDETIDFGFYALPTSIGDFVWNDLNKNGQQDTDEPGISGVTVTLVNCITNAMRTTTTDANGKYLFENLMPGSYWVEFAAPMGYAFIMPNIGNDASDSDANATGVTECYDLVSGQPNLTVDAGLWKVMPSIDIEKYTNGDDADTPTGPKVLVGGIVEWKYVIKNTGNVELTGVAVTDDKLGAITCPKSTLAVMESMTCTKTGTAMEGPYANIGKVTGQYIGTTVMDQDPSHYYGAKDQMECGTGTPGYWKNHPNAWPTQSITIGGLSYSKAKAIDLISEAVSGDKTYTLFPALVSAKLNVMTGANASCISDTITAADTWMKTHKPGSGVSGSSRAWKIGEPLYLMLDRYNNGLLCAPHRDSIKDQCSSTWPAGSKKTEYYKD
ncbi:SdrD B-like domain-containing protein [Trichloromonas sp.]|uniref:SdrD B-like domain-containing protein n=1 Tax=Trichloromonas sp. TaxID=3069249 RepID=UPI003D81361B